MSPSKASTERKYLDTYVSRPQIKGRKTVRAGTPMYGTRDGRTNMRRRMTRVLLQSDRRRLCPAMDTGCMRRTNED